MLPPFLGLLTLFFFFFHSVWQNIKWFLLEKKSPQISTMLDQTHLLRLVDVHSALKGSLLVSIGSGFHRTCKCTAKVSVCMSRNVILGCSRPLMNNLVFFSGHTDFCRKDIGAVRYIPFFFCFHSLISLEAVYIQTEPLCSG